MKGLPADAKFQKEFPSRSVASRLSGCWRHFLAGPSPKQPSQLSNTIGSLSNSYCAILLYLLGVCTSFFVGAVPPAPTVFGIEAAIYLAWVSDNQVPNAV